MRIGKLADKYSLDTRTIDYYSNTAKILPYKTLPGSNYRDYDEESERTLLKILIFRDAGLSISQITDALKDPSYFSKAKLEEHIAKIKKHREEDMKRYDDMIEFAENLRDTEMMLPQIIQIFKNTPYETQISNVIRQGFRSWKKASDSLRQVEDIDEFSDMIDSALNNLQRKRILGSASSEVQQIFTRIFSRMKKYRGIFLYLALSVSSNMDMDIYEIEKECGEGSSEVLKSILMLCADWFLEAKVRERILDKNDFQNTFAERIREFDRQYSKFDEAAETSSVDDIFDMIQDLYSDNSEGDLLRGIVGGIEVSMSEGSDAEKELDKIYGKGFTQFLIQALDQYIMGIENVSEAHQE